MSRRLSMITAALKVMVLTMILAEPTHAASVEVTFKTAEKAPTGFDRWTFFWKMPTIDSDATLEYVIIQPDGKEYFRKALPRTVTGAFHVIQPDGKVLTAQVTGVQNIRSDFAKNSNGCDPRVFYNQQIIFKFIVNKGEIEFDQDSTFHFEFGNTIIKAIKK